jgi:hypothetical protein
LAYSLVAADLVDLALTGQLELRGDTATAADRTRIGTPMSGDKFAIMNMSAMRVMVSQWLADRGPRRIASTFGDSVLGGAHERAMLVAPPLPSGTGKEFDVARLGADVRAEQPCGATYALTFDAWARRSSSVRSGSFLCSRRSRTKPMTNAPMVPVDATTLDRTEAKPSF